MEIARQGRNNLFSIEMSVVHNLSFAHEGARWNGQQPARGRPLFGRSLSTPNKWTVQFLLILFTYLFTASNWVFDTNDDDWDIWYDGVTGSGFTGNCIESKPCQRAGSLSPSLTLLYLHTHPHSVHTNTYFVFPVRTFPATTALSPALCLRTACTFHPSASHSSPFAIR